MLVIAGAGTGKTTVLTKRIAHLVREGHARPDEILAVTYTKNAAQEMRQRVQEELRGTDLSGLRIATFHEYCKTLLEENGKKFGVLDDQDLWIYLRRRIRELNLKYFVRAAQLSKFLDDLLAFFRHCHDELVSPEKYEEYVQRLERGELPVPRVSRSKEADTLSDEEVVGRCREIAGVFTTVERMLREENLGTFGHMITNAYQLLQQDAELASRARARFILVDEFQDVNFAQVKVLQKLAGAGAQRFCGRRSGPGHLSLPRSFERCVRSLSAPLSRRQSDQAGEKSPLAVAHSELRLCFDLQKPERLRRRTRFAPITSVRS